MSKNSHKALYEQLMTWPPTLSSQRKKRVKRKQNGQNRSK